MNKPTRFRHLLALVAMTALAMESMHASDMQGAVDEGFTPPLFK